MVDATTAIVLAVIALAEHVLALLIQRQTQPATPVPVPVSSLPRLPAWDEPDAFTAAPALHRTADAALKLAEDGEAGPAWNQVVLAGMRSGNPQALLVAQAARAAWRVGPGAAQAVLAASREIVV